MEQADREPGNKGGVVTEIRHECGENAGHLLAKSVHNLNDSWCKRGAYVEQKGETQEGMAGDKKHKM